MPNAKAVLPVPGAPAKSNALPAIFLDRIKSTMSPHASRALSWPTRPEPMGAAAPVAGSRPRPLMWVWAETRTVLLVDWTSSILNLFEITDFEWGEFK